MIHLPNTPDPRLTAMVARDCAATEAAQRAGLLADLDRVHPDDQGAFVRTLVVAMGGTLQEPGRTTWQPQGHVLTLAGITGLGDTLPEAIHDWQACARRSLRGDAA
jgi:hypothetical protein